MKFVIAMALFLTALLFPALGADKPAYPKNLKIVTRKDWEAKAPVAEMKPHEPQFLTIHHTATKQKPDRSVEDKLQGLQKFSQSENKLADGRSKPAWPDVPYHFYITCKGEIAEGREIGFVGDTNTEYDPTGHILVTLEGNFEEEEPTPEQMKATRALVKWLAKKYKIPASKLKSHKDYAKTACPGEKLQARLDEIRAALP